MHHRSITRRTVLRGAGGITLALPFLEATAGKGYAAGVPPRLVIYFNGQGTIPAQWKPASTGDLQLSPMLKALEPYKGKLNVISGLENRVRRQMKGNDHIPSGVSLLTAQVYQTPGADGGPAAGPSIEQVVASRIGTGTRYKTLDLRIGNVGVGEYQLFYSAPGVPVSGDEDPNRVLNRIFTNLPMTGTTGPTPAPAPTLTAKDRLKAKRGSVLAAVRGHYKQVAAALGAEDRVRLEAHAARIEEVEATIKPTPGGTITPGGVSAAGCSKPTLNLPAGYTTRTSNDPDTNKAHSKIAAMAMACDLTRVVTMQHMEYHGATFPWMNLGLPSGWHDFVHNHGAGAPDKLAKAFSFYTDAFLELLKAMDAIPENGKTLLDNSLVLWISEFGDGGDHNVTNLPVVLAGGLAGALKTGRHLSFPSRTTNDLYVTLLNLFGGTDKEFGYGGSSFNSGPLAVG